MSTQYKVISDCLCFTSNHKAKKIENHLNNLTAAGWEFVALDSAMFFGIDVGFYLVLKRLAPSNESTQP